MRDLRLTLALSLALVVSTAAGAQAREDSQAIRRAASDYIEGWYGGDGERMARALHPELVKRIMLSDTAGNAWIAGMGATELVRRTRVAGGTGTPAADRRTDITILDVFQNAASARIDAGGWIDYLHLVRFRGRWVILNVLWENRTPASAPRG